jgi:hypothetical protein
MPGVTAYRSPETAEKFSTPVSAALNGAKWLQRSRISLLVTRHAAV